MNQLICKAIREKRILTSRMTAIRELLNLIATG